MKKSKLLVAAVTASVLALGGGALAGCNKHSHEYSQDWQKDGTGHWHVATCDDLKEGDKDYIKDFAAHVWGDDNECDVCHYVKTTPPPTPTEKVTLNKTELNLGLGNLEAELTATVNGGGTVTWSSDNPEVVAVNEETGYVEAFKPGAATITATVVGGTDKATCEVSVADGYYLIGGQDAAWNKVGVFGQSGVVYFMPTETAGIYKTESTELPRMGNFQVALVGVVDANWHKQAFNGDYIAAGDTVLSRNSGGNIAVEKHGNYTITLDLTGEKAVISGVCDEVIDDGEVQDIYYIIGSANKTSGWTTVTDAADAGEYVFTANEDGTYSLTVELAKGGDFKVAIAGMAWNGSLGESAIPRDLLGTKGTATKDTTYKLTWSDSDNIGVGLSGRYTFTLDPDGAANNKLTYTFEETEDTETGDEVTILHYYIKGDALATDNGWNVGTDEAYELKETGEGTGIYAITVELKANGGFMFWSCAEDKSGNVTGIQVDYFNNGNSTFTATDNCVTATTNFSPTAAGWYTITLNPETKELTFSYSATAPTV